MTQEQNNAAIHQALEHKMKIQKQSNDLKEKISQQDEEATRASYSIYYSAKNLGHNLSYIWYFIYRLIIMVYNISVYMDILSVWVMMFCHMRSVFFTILELRKLVCTIY